MKTLTIFILSLFTIALLSYTPQQTTVIKTVPVNPRLTIVKPFWGAYGIQNDMSTFILENVKKGYIVKTLTLDSEENGYQRGIVVLEKY